MIELWKEENDCTGCAACYQICPQSAISMKENSCGFLFPSINAQLCIECGACVIICPMKRDVRKSVQEPMAFALRHRDENVLSSSSSGGAFTAIAQAFVKEKYAIFGASIDEHLQVSHQVVQDIKKLDLLRKSKYIQSNINNSYVQVENYLNTDVRVLFVGTPCQIAGLKSYLGREEPNLLTCDLVCAGVQSQRFFDRYVHFMEEKRDTTVNRVEFRNKEKRGWERSSLILYFENGERYERICHAKDTAYMNSSLFQGGNRASCYSCRFNTLPRQGDFTIGDLWGWQQITPDWNDNKGISLVLVNTKKAQAQLPKLNQFAQIKLIDLKLATQKNPNIIRPTTKPIVRDNYIEDMQRMTFEELTCKWLKPRGIFRRLMSQLKYVLNKIAVSKKSF